jgi:hypothetical protein
MKRAFSALPYILAISAFLASPAHAADATRATDINISVTSAFKVEFYPPDGTHVVYSTSVPFTNIDPTQTFALADGRTVNDGKSDVGLYCISSDGSTWYLKIGISAGTIPPSKLKYYISQPYMWNGTTSVPTDGTVTPNPPAWTAIPKGSSTVVYQSGSMDRINTPFGTLITINYQLDTAGMSSGSFTATVTYTMTTSP